MTYEIRYRIAPDCDPVSPREEFEHVSTMVCWHRCYKLGDAQPRESPEEYLNDLSEPYIQEISERVDRVRDYFPWHHPYQQVVEDYLGRAHRKALDEHYVILTLWERGNGDGVFASEGDLDEDGKLGIIYCTMEQARYGWGGGNPAATDEEIRSKAERCLKAEVREYDQYLTGDVWGYVVERVELDDDGDVIDTEELDSCWGFYGREYCEEEAEAVAEAYRKDAIEEAEEAAVLVED